MPPAAFVRAAPEVLSAALLAMSMVPLFELNAPDCRTSVPALRLREPELLNAPPKPRVVVPALVLVSVAPAWLLNTTVPPEQQLSQDALPVMLNCPPERLFTVVVPLEVRSST